MTINRSSSLGARHIADLAKYERLFLEYNISPLHSLSEHPVNDVLVYLQVSE